MMIEVKVFVVDFTQSYVRPRVYRKVMIMMMGVDGIGAQMRSVMDMM